MEYGENCPQCMHAQIGRSMSCNPHAEQLGNPSRKAQTIKLKGVTMQIREFAQHQLLVLRSLDLKQPYELRACNNRVAYFSRIVFAFIERSPTGSYGLLRCCCITTHSHWTESGLQGKAPIAICAQLPS